MRMLPFLVVAFFFMLSCQNNSFNSPQPSGAENLDSIPENLFGEYLSKDGASKICIEPKGIYCTYEYEVVCNKDSDFKNQFSNPPIRTAGDTLIYLVNFTDTMFWLSGDNIIREYKGHYLISKKVGTNTWSVYNLKLEKGVLTISVVSTKKELKQIKESVESIQDSTIHDMIFTRKQFSYFVDCDSFTTVDTYIKIK